MAKKLGRGKAIRSINPTAEYNIVNETVEGYESIEWLNDTAPISDADIDAKLAELQAEEDAKVQAKADNKASAKAKLIAGEPLTEEEANEMIGG
tara:strand:+ start:81 stop:362 length:282 start_codon:yes stop_codon:yes gene_type:complete